MEFCYVINLIQFKISHKIFLNFVLTSLQTQVSNEKYHRTHKYYYDNCYLISMKFTDTCTVFKIFQLQSMVWTYKIRISQNWSLMAWMYFQAFFNLDYLSITSKKFQMVPSMDWKKLLDCTWMIITLLLSKMELLITWLDFETWIFLWIQLEGIFTFLLFT